MQFKTLKMLLSSLALSSLTACAANTTATVRSIHDLCLIAKGITFSEAHEGDVETAENKYDTPETVKQVKDHDLAYDAVCSTEDHNQ